MRVPFLAAFLMPLFLTGCDDAANKIHQYVYKGTTIGVTKCFERNKGSLVSDATIKQLCIERHEKRFSDSYIKGNAKYDFTLLLPNNSDRAEAFVISINNSSSENVMTRLTLAMTHEDNKGGDGKRITEYVTKAGLWLEPGKESTYRFEDLKFRPRRERIRQDGEFLFDWTVESALGVTVNVE